MGHSLLSPSSAHRWLVCPASLVEGQKYPETTSDYAAEGTRAHAFAADILNGKTPTIPDPEMGEAVTVYVDTVRAMSAGAVFTAVEQELDTSDVLGYPEQSGTADFVAVVGDELQVHDLKYGKGVRVDANANKQLIIYGLAALETVEMFIDAPITKVRLVIHQPRLNSVSEALYTVEEMAIIKAEIQDRVQHAVKLLTAPCTTDDYHPGEKQCKFCPHKANCEALQNFCLKTVAEDFEDLDSAEQAIKAVAPKQLPVERLSIIHGLSDLITDLLSAIATRVSDLLHNGEEVPGFKLVMGKQGNRKWEDEAKAEEKMKSMRLKKEEMYDEKIKSVAALEKVLKARPRAWNSLEPFITRAEAKPVVAPVSDKRPAIIVDKQVAESFEDLTAEAVNINDLI